MKLNWNPIPVNSGEGHIVINRTDRYGSDPGFSVYPNPAKDQLSVRTNQNATGSIILSDINGRLIKKVSIQGQLTSINTGGLRRGIYPVKIISDYSVQVKKVIIE